MICAGNYLRILQDMSFSFFDNAKTGQLLSRLTSDIAEIGELAFLAPFDFIICTLTMGGTLVLLLYLNLKLGSHCRFALNP
jgi:ATP-binding cassette subfamily B protein